ncbi:MAG: outer membrane protein bacterial [Verrucomicrobiales bacterium]|nr:outer membrane protein bacterial [Verrucomicrobiales bacterium]
MLLAVAVNRHSLSGQINPAIPVFLGIVGLSAGFFVLFTLPPRQQPQDPATAGGGGQDGAAPVVARPPASAVKPPAKPKTPPAVYARPVQLLDAVTAELRAGNLEGAVKLGGPAFVADARTNFLKLLLTKGGYKVPDKGTVFADAGTAAGMPRYEIRLLPDATGTPPPAGPLWVDLFRDETTKSWRMKSVVVSPALLAQATTELRRHEVVITPAELETAKPDPLQQTWTFLSAVLARNFHAARQVTNRDKITQEKLAGLCIVFEEGEYQPAAERPIVVTTASKEAAIALVKVHSAKQKTDAEIGITLHPNGEGVWTIEALDFSSLLESYVKASGTGKVFYTPVVKSPQGGESLVVYFDFNSAKLVPRAISQLEIVARLLATDPAKKLRITGHADDLGTDDFNYRLSADRAKNVRNFLHKLGVAPTQIETIGFGSTAPLDPNKRTDGSDNPEGRSRNRRTEIYLDF